MDVVGPIPESDLDSFATIYANAYPGFDLDGPDKRQKLQERLRKISADNSRNLYGLYRDRRLLGVMILYDFQIRLLSVMAPAGGVGQVAVDLAHKKEKVAMRMMQFFLRHYRDKSVPLLMLYPFRPDFYKRMGFGYGTKMNQYRLRPDALPKRGAKQHIRFLSLEDCGSLLACYNRLALETHGMIAREETHFQAVVANASLRIVGCEEDDRLTGYVIFGFEKGPTFIRNDLIVHELVFEQRNALTELMSFLHSQHDQIEHIVVNTQDEGFHFLLNDPRNDSGRLLPSAYHETNTQGVGLMYRIIDVPGFFRVLQQHSFGGQTCKLRLSLVDSFFPENATDTIVHFIGGRPHLSQSDDYEVTIRLDVSEFSSLVMGTVTFHNLFQYGLADISDPDYVDRVGRLFQVDEKPICMTAF